jgi:quinol monooxygenase YgiN
MMARPEKRKELSQTLHSIVRQVQKEIGCLHSGFYQDLERENDFLIEEWATQKESDDHLQSDIFTVLMGAGSLMQRPPEIVIHTVSHSSDLEALRPKPHGR